MIQHIAGILWCESLGMEPTAHLLNGDAERDLGSSFLHLFGASNLRACSEYLSYAVGPLASQGCCVEQQWVRMEYEDVLLIPLGRL